MLSTTKVALTTCVLLLSACQGANPSSHLNDDETANRPVLVCKSNVEVDGWDGSSTHDFIRYTAYVKSDTELEKAEVKGAYMSDSRDLEADPDPNNEYSRRRFRTLEDAWCWFNILLPKGFSESTSSFRGTLQYTCEEWFSYSYVDMKCFLARR